MIIALFEISMIISSCSELIINFIDYIYIYKCYNVVIDHEKSHNIYSWVYGVECCMIGLVQNVDLQSILCNSLQDLCNNLDVGLKD
jgi:hypothetical protein